MNTESFYKECYLEMCKVIEESYTTLCSLWDEIGVHSQEKRNEMKNDYINSCKQVLQNHINKIVGDAENVLFGCIGNVQEKQKLIQTISEKNNMIKTICDKLNYNYENVSKSYGILFD